MFSFEAILISNLCLIITSVFCTTPEKATSIEELTKSTKTILNRVKALDSAIKTSERMGGFEIINYESLENNTSITCDIYIINDFISEFQRLVQCTEDVVRSYTNEIDNIRELFTHEVGKKSDRDELCRYYEEEILPKLTIKGDGKGNRDVENLEKKLKDALNSLIHKVRDIEVMENSRDVPPEFIYDESGY